MNLHRPRQQSNHNLACFPNIGYFVMVKFPAPVASPSHRIYRQAPLTVPMHVQCREHPTELNCVTAVNHGAPQHTTTLMR